MNRILQQFQYIKSRKTFWTFLLIKLVLGATLASSYMSELFLPFLNDYISNGWSSPWDLALDGKISGEFPYSGMMLVLMSLGLSFSHIVLPEAVSNLEWIQLLLARLPLLVADLVILLVLLNWFKDTKKKVLLYYWCSPILIYISYVHGQLDVLPTAFFFLSLFALFRRRHFSAGFFLGAGIACKFHLLIALPFLVAFMVKNVIKQTALAKKLVRFFCGFLLPIVLFVLPFVFKPGYQKLVLGTGETAKMFALNFPFSADTIFYLAPAALLVLLIRFISSYRVNRNLLLLCLTLVYSTLVVLVPPMPGWYFWSVPLLIYFFLDQDEVKPFVFWGLNLAFVVYYTGVDFFPENLSTPIIAGASFKSLAFTGLQSIYSIIIYWLYVRGVKKNSFFTHKMKPMLIGVGGDSGAGKDTFVETLTCVLGKDNWVQNNGDDYHRWERGHIEWSKKTHLDPGANDMYLPVTHIESLKKGKAIQKSTYDHGTGRFTAPISLDPHPFILFVGLHPFYIKRLRELMDLKIYIGPNEQLRKYWKIQRDKKHRGYSKEQVLEKIQQRQEDSENYIHPQRDQADWVVSYEALSEIGNDFEPIEDLKLKVIHKLSNDVHMEELLSQLNKVSSVVVQWKFSEDLNSQIVSFQGKIEQTQVQNIGEELYRQIYEYIGHEDLEFKEDLDGLNQLLFLAILKSRFKVTEEVR